jgi:hypothetical protein
MLEYGMFNRDTGGGISTSHARRRNNVLSGNASIARMWQPWKRHSLPYSAEKLLIPLPIPHPAHIAVTIHNRDSEDPIPLDFELCQNILKAVEDSHGHHFNTEEVLEGVIRNVARFRGGGGDGGGGDSSFDSVGSQISVTGVNGEDVGQEKGSGIGDGDRGGKQEGESYRWRQTEWAGATARRRNNSGSIRVDLASPEDVTLDTDATRVVFSSYGTTV